MQNVNSIHPNQMFNSGAIKFWVDYHINSIEGFWGMANPDCVAVLVRSLAHTDATEISDVK